VAEEKKKKPNRLDRLGYGSGFTALVKSHKLAKSLERKQKTKVFAVGVVFVATNGSFVYNLEWLRDKKLLYEFVSSDVAIRHPEILGMAESIAEFLNKEDGANIMLVRQKAGEE
jgi:hypothetical protein